MIIWFCLFLSDFALALDLSYSQLGSGDSLQRSASIGQDFSQRLSMGLNYNDSTYIDFNEESQIAWEAGAEGSYDLPNGWYFSASGNYGREATTIVAYGLGIKGQYPLNTMWDGELYTDLHVSWAGKRYRESYDDLGQTYTEEVTQQAITVSVSQELIVEGPTAQLGVTLYQYKENLDEWLEENLDVSDDFTSVVYGLPSYAISASIYGDLWSWMTWSSYIATTITKLERSRSDSFGGTLGIRRSWIELGIEGLYSKTEGQSGDLLTGIYLSI